MTSSLEAHIFTALEITRMNRPFQIIMEHADKKEYQKLLHGPKVKEWWQACTVASIEAFKSGAAETTTAHLLDVCTSCPYPHSVHRILPLWRISTDTGNLVDGLNMVRNYVSGHSPTTYARGVTMLAKGEDGGDLFVSLLEDKEKEYIWAAEVDLAQRGIGSLGKVDRHPAHLPELHGWISPFCVNPAPGGLGGPTDEFKVRQMMLAMSRSDDPFSNAAAARLGKGIEWM